MSSNVPVAEATRDDAVLPERVQQFRKVIGYTDLHRLAVAIELDPFIDGFKLPSRASKNSSPPSSTGPTAAPATSIPPTRPLRSPPPDAPRRTKFIHLVDRD